MISVGEFGVIIGIEY